MQVFVDSTCRCQHLCDAVSQQQQYIYGYSGNIIIVLLSIVQYKCAIVFVTVITALLMS